jgi:predicted metal-dependent enzyme (double-stranded beta helix superfamily)
MTVIARPLTDRATTERLTPPATTTGPLATARRLAADDSLWRPHLDFDPVSRYYRRLLATGDHEAWLLTWLPGQGTPWHDHGGSAGAFVVLQGALVERTARHGLVRGPRRIHGRGATHAFGPEYLHRVTNEGTDPAVSLHVYAPRLASMTDYEEHDGVLAPTEIRTAEAW